MSVISPFDPGAIEHSSIDRSPDRQATGDSVLGKYDFLKLLVTQLGNQDPLNPMDGQEFAAQLAQFSSVEQLLNIGDALAQNGELNALLAQSVNSGVAAGLIGKTVRAAGNSVGWNGEHAAPLNFELADAADEVTIRIHDESGKIVRTLDLPVLSSGEHSFEWDGMDSSGLIVAEGSYTFEVVAADGEGNTVEAQTYLTGVVDRVTFGPEGVSLWIGSSRVSMADVESVE